MTRGPKVLAELSNEASHEPARFGAEALPSGPRKLWKMPRRSVGESLDGAAKLPERIAELEMEREKLLARIAELEEEVSPLSGLTEEVEGRLDGAMGEIRAALAR